MPIKTDLIKLENIVLEHSAPEKDVKEKKLLFIHSSGHGSWMWKNFLPYFAGRGFDSWAVNLRGHHLSGPVKDWSAVGVNEYLEDIDLAVKKLGRNVVLVGHSMSGLLVLKYAEAHNVAGLIVSQSGPPKSAMEKRGIEMKGPSPAKPGRTMKDGAFLPMQDRELVEATLFDRGNVEKESVDLVLDMLGEESVRATKEIVNMPVDPTKITAPVYILGFETSKIGAKIPVDINKVLAEEFKARGFAVIEPGGHNYMLEKNWQDFARQFEAWIEFS